MKRTIPVVIVLIFLLSSASFAQIGQWTWMSGDSAANNQGHFGTQGVFSPANKPPALYEAAEFKDKQGHFWLFGGQDSTSAPCLGYNTLWEYDPAINQWAWIKGDTIVDKPGVYGTINVPSPTNCPGSRIYGYPSWVDTAGNFWLFGGYGYDVNGSYGELNDLWKYNIATNEWTWMKGPNTYLDNGNYGAFRVEAATNEPPSRCEFSSSWTNEVDNTLWMFGGDNTSYNNILNGTSFNDMWRYNIATGNWTWMAGTNSSTTFPPAVYGTKGVEASTNVPSGRWAFGHWKDSAGNFYFFGGLQGQQNNNICYNDMWRFNITTYNWTWISGTNATNDLGHYGPICIGDTSYCPPARFENRACWKRGADNFVLYGGSGPGIVTNDSTYNDFWNYNVTTNVWTWINGSTLNDQPSVYGIKTVPSVNNHPSARDGSVGWTDAQGNIWLFGGYEADGVAFSENGKMYNDLWRWTPDTAAPIANFFSHPDTGCAPLTVTFNNTSVNSTNYYWSFGDGGTSQAINPIHTYINPGTYTVTLVAINSTPCSSGVDSIVKVNLITVITAPTGTFVGDTLNGCDSLTVHFTNQTIGGIAYHWSFGDGGTSQAINPTHTYSTTGTFTVTLIAYGTYCNDTIIRQQYIHVVIPQSVTSSFTADTFAGCKPLTVTFSNTSTNGTNYFWNFGDNTTDTAMNPTHIYDTSGTFTVKLITYNISACGVVKDSVIHTTYITVYPYAVASFTQSPDTGCAPFQLTFNNTSTNASSYFWRFGDGQTSSGISPTHTFTNQGTYSITLVAHGVGGCNDSVTFNSIIVDTLPNVASAFVADTFSGCNPFTVHFTNNSTNGTSYIWNFGYMNATSDSTNPTFTYTDSGTFSVKLITMSTNRCGTTVDSSLHPSYIKVEEPVSVKANFTGEPLIGCAPLTVTFNNSSVNGTHYYWNFGDGFTDTTMNPKHTFLNPSTPVYTVTLVVSHPGQKCDNLPDTMTLQVQADTCQLYIPNVFSPNGDGKNDVFELEAVGFAGYHLIIFDRWGLKMFESYDHNYKWNGLIDNTGGKAPDGTYYYIFYSIDYNGEASNSHGFLTLIR